ncbi:MAG: heme-binding domain-containing protein [Robiginitalea sp.]|nr:heme-binding domain-containing protein [Robiginitalea sp.]
MKLGKKIAWALLIAFVAIQFYRPERNESTEEHLSKFLSETNPPEQVAGILESSCYDCHTDHTNYPWYNQVAPVSWWLEDHIEEGKEHLNFSAWDSYSPKKKDHKLEEVVETVESGEMPLNEYTWTHADADLTEQQRQAVMDWAQQTRTLYQLGDPPK